MDKSVTWAFVRVSGSHDPDADFDMLVRFKEGDRDAYEVSLTRTQIVELAVALIRTAEAEVLFEHQMRLSKSMSGRAL
jgi:hypothetical protein